MTPQQLTSYYRQYLREVNHIQHYSFREYAKRKIRTDFRAKSNVGVCEELDRLKRMRHIINLYCKMI